MAKEEFQMKISGHIGRLHRSVRIAIAFVSLGMECLLGVVLWHMLGFTSAVKAAIIIPIASLVVPSSGWYLWRHLGYLCIDDNAVECLQLPIIKGVPEIHQWKVIFRLRNSTAWEAVVSSCSIADKSVLGNNITLGTVSFDKLLYKWQSGQVVVNFDCGLHEGPCDIRIRLVFHLEYIIGAGIPRKDRYVCFVKIGRGERNV